MLINALPNGTIDGIIQGHRHKFAHHFYKGTFLLIKTSLMWELSTEDSISMYSILNF